MRVRKIPPIRPRMNIIRAIQRVESLKIAGGLEDV